MGSLSWCMLINETRRLFKEGHLVLTESEKAIIDTNAGQLGDYKGEQVPLDAPFFQFESKKYGNLFGVFTLKEGKTLKVNFCENENNLGRLVAESEKHENYMFIQNLQSLIEKASEILEIPREELDDKLEGHQWAVDHVTTSIDDIEEVNSFLKHRDVVQNFMDEANHRLNEKKKSGGLKRWFKEKWVDVSRKVDGKHPPCGRGDADKGAYPKCRPKKKVSKSTPKTASSYSKKEKKSMTAKKRKAEKKPRKGKKPNYTSEQVNETKLCARGKAAAKRKYDVYPCVPLESQALTQEGWKYYSELSLGDNILTYSMDKDCLEWQPILNLHYYQNAPLWEMYKSTGFSIRCTPNHKWVVEKRTTKNGKDCYKKAELIETKDINKSSRILVCSTLKNDELIIENFSKKDDWTKNVLHMSSNQRETFLASAIIYDGWDKGLSTKIEGRHTFGFSQKNIDHNNACLLSAYLNGYYVNSFAKKDVSQSTIIRNKKYHSTTNIKFKESSNADVWCPTTANNTWIMKQNGLITITGNSAYANAYAVKVCKGQVSVGGKKKTASGYQKKKGKPKNEEVEMMEAWGYMKEYLQNESVISEDYDFDLVKEAEYRGKKVKLNKPFRQSSGGKKFAVYVKSKKGNIKKVRFGAQGYRVRNNSKGRASNFQKRHNCKSKKDRTKAGYWSCNVSRYAKQLGLSSKRKW